MSVTEDRESVKVDDFVRLVFSRVSPSTKDTGGTWWKQQSSLEHRRGSVAPSQQPSSIVGSG